MGGADALQKISIMDFKIIIMDIFREVNVARSTQSDVSHPGGLRRQSFPTAMRRPPMRAGTFD
jgi:hypothetical protein